LNHDIHKTYKTYKTKTESLATGTTVPSPESRRLASFPRKKKSFNGFAGFVTKNN